MTKSEEYGQPLDELDELFARGKKDRGRYEVMRAVLLVEATRPKRSKVVSVVSFLAILVVAMLILPFLNLS